MVAPESSHTTRLKALIDQACCIPPELPAQKRWEELRTLTINHWLNTSDFTMVGRYCGVFTAYPKYLQGFTFGQLQEQFWELGYRSILDTAGQHKPFEQLNQDELLAHLILHFQRK